MVGASSGIGRELAKALSKNGYSVGITARRLDLLKSLQSELAGESRVKQMDVSKPEEAVRLLGELIEELGGMDLIVISAGVDYFTPNLGWKETRDSIDVNVCGFTAVANAAYDYFAAHGGGRIAGISSFAALRGSGSHPTYSATKAFVSNYMEGLNVRAAKAGLDIIVTDIRPGFVDTPMTEGQPGMFWVATPEKAARRIFDAVRRKKRIAYITRRWDILARVVRVLPFWIHAKI